MSILYFLLRKRHGLPGQTNQGFRHLTDGFTLQLKIPEFGCNGCINVKDVIAKRLQTVQMSLHGGHFFRGKISGGTGRLPQNKPLIKGGLHNMTLSYNNILVHQALQCMERLSKHLIFIHRVSQQCKLTGQIRFQPIFRRSQPGDQFNGLNGGLCKSVG